MIFYIKNNRVEVKMEADIIFKNVNYLDVKNRKFMKRKYRS